MFVVFIAIAILGCHGSLALAGEGCYKTPVIFNFGDSNSDTGGYAAAHGQFYGSPIGRVYFEDHFSNRFCDGRLIVDFLCDRVKAKYLSPYLETLTSSFKNGVNFAVAGAKTVQEDGDLFTLATQVLQFRRFHAFSLILNSKGNSGTFRDDDFKNALYMIDIGQNDLSGAFLDNHLTKPQLPNITSFLDEIRSAISEMYRLGGKHFWVHNTGPLGCLPYMLMKMGTNVRADYDEVGCLKYLNDVAQEFNTILQKLCEELKSDLKDAVIVYVDMYTIKYNVISNYALYGFESALMACCGGGGPPYNANISCGPPGQGIVCEKGKRYISWDGLHYTDSANAVFAAQIATTNYSTPPLKFNYFCT
nr:GDSL esterase/lipase LIP-4-like [Ipomoea batatas]